jgi:3-phosphoshikimate 1-carboxyvinyltransferase
MDFLLQHQDDAGTNHHPIHLELGGSKSETNRLLLLQALFPQINVENKSTSDDSRVLEQALNTSSRHVDIQHAGTAMRFLTAYFAFCNPGKEEVILTGSRRMKQRPIKLLVDALCELGAQIRYIDEVGFPPLGITPMPSQNKIVTIRGDVSSQYITALILVGTHMTEGLTLHIDGELTSKPYVDMTLYLLGQLGIKITQREVKAKLVIEVPPLAPHMIPPRTIVVESDWSSASYWYSWVALQPVGYQISLSHFKKQSLQGDAAIATIYTDLGVSTHWDGTQLFLKKTSTNYPKHLELDMVKTPDLAQTVFATCLGLGVSLTMTGLHTLKIKETDRIEAMRLMGLRFRESVITTTSKNITLIPSNSNKWGDEPIEILTFQDHRMAMAFAPLALKTPLVIRDAEVVNKSYPEFWKHMRQANLSLTEI